MTVVLVLLLVAAIAYLLRPLLTRFIQYVQAQNASEKEAQRELERLKEMRFQAEHELDDSLGLLKEEKQQHVE